MCQAQETLAEKISINVVRKNKISNHHSSANSKEFLNKTLALDPSNAFAIENMKLLK
jgi:hypothetical protein